MVYHFQDTAKGARSPLRDQDAERIISLVNKFDTTDAYVHAQAKEFNVRTLCARRGIHVYSTHAATRMRCKRGTPSLWGGGDAGPADTRIVGGRARLSYSGHSPSPFVVMKPLHVMPSPTPFSLKCALSYSSTLHKKKCRANDTKYSVYFSSSEFYQKARGSLRFCC